LCREAIKLGIAGIAITDHCDVGMGARYCEAVRGGLWREIQRAREIFGDSLEISMGIELGEPHHNLELAKGIAGGGELDFVIGSVHRLRGEEDFHDIDYRRADLDYLFRKYCDELYELSECGCCDVIAHINYQIRYMSSAQRESLDLTKYHPALSEVLESAVRNGVCVEVNTSCLRMGASGLLPSKEVLRTFRSLGGRTVTVGSDAHSAGNIGRGLREAIEHLRGAGFGSYAFFKKKAPVTVGAAPPLNVG
jgi:histidinol-phosphatase (PHP family)